MMRYLLVVSVAMLLSGCAGTAKLIENRVACTADKAEAHVVSKWGLFSIGARIADADAKVICK